MPWQTNIIFTMSRFLSFLESLAFSRIFDERIIALPIAPIAKRPDAIRSKGGAVGVKQSGNAVPKRVLLFM